MLIDQDTTREEYIAQHLGQLQDRWSALGVWCGLWDSAGKMVAPSSQASPFFKTLWNRGQRFRNAVGHAAVSGKSGIITRDMLDIHGLSMACLPIPMDDGTTACMVICMVTTDVVWGESFQRLCGDWEVDAALLRSWADRHTRYSEESIGPLLEVIRSEIAMLVQAAGQQDEVTQMTDQLADAYEELNLIYRIAALMPLTQRPREHFGQLFEYLAQATPITTMAAVLSGDEVLTAEDRLIIGGEPIIDSEQVYRLLDCLPSASPASPGALILNELGDYPELSWAASWLERLIAVPIICNQRLLGMVFMINRRGQQDFTSIDARLVQSVIDRSAVYLENVLLYADLNMMLMGLTHALVSAIDAKDPYTCGHSQRVAHISKRIAEGSGATVAEAERVYLSALLHDVGKIGIPEAILCKAGRLTDEEMDHMRKHPEIGARILGGIKQLEDILPGVMHHHEWISGRGYPSGLSGDQVPWLARVICLADSYDAMTSGRTYRSALHTQSALAEIRRGSGTQFDPRLAEVLIDLIDHHGLVAELDEITGLPASNELPVSCAKPAIPPVS